jgi:general secretion pathway protein G
MMLAGLMETAPRAERFARRFCAKPQFFFSESFSAALDLYYLDNGGYPDANEGLTALVERPSSARAWNGPYLKTGSVPVDPWGHPYLY